MIYLDAAATTLEKPPQVRAGHGAGGGTGPPAPGRAAIPPPAGRRETAASGVGPRRQRYSACQSPENVVFTMNATHGFNVAIRSLVVPGSRVVISGYRGTNAVCRPLYAIPEVRLTVVDAPPFRREQAAEEFRRAILAGADAVIVNHVSNVFGCVQPLEEIAGVCRSRGVPLLVDASQSAGTLPLHLTELGAAFIAMPGHKGLYGPQGTGLLLCGERPARPLLLGGTGSASRDRQMPPTLPDRPGGRHPQYAGHRRAVGGTAVRPPTDAGGHRLPGAAAGGGGGAPPEGPAGGGGIHARKRPPSHRCGVLPGGGPGLRRAGGGAGTPGYRPAGRGFTVRRWPTARRGHWTPARCA